MKLFYRNIMIIAIIIVVTMGCTESNKKLKLLKGPFYEEYPAFYNDQIYYELKNNSDPLNADEFFVKINKNDSNLIPVSYVDSNYYWKFDNLALQAIITPVDKGINMIFYKRSFYEASNSGRAIIHIEYPLDSSYRKKCLMFLLNKFKQQDFERAFYIMWSSKSTKFQYKNSANDTKQVYMWGINKSTDTLWTNLSYKTIRSMYPDFHGKYIYHKYREIILDNNKSTMDHAFFNAIKFIE